ncbi:MAG: DUF447 domain-containing protein [Candidatus Helarchaeota archaeon]
MTILTELNVKPHFIYETIVTTYMPDKNMPNAAPMGIQFLNGEQIIIKPFIDTQTYKNIAYSRCAVVNFVYDLEIFFESALGKRVPKLPLAFFEPATKIDAPRLKNATAIVELRIKEIDVVKKWATVKGDIICWDITTPPFYPLNRGDHLLLESIIHTTRILAFQGNPKKVKALVELIDQYREIIEKVAPHGPSMKLMNKIQAIIKNIRG